MKKWLPVFLFLSVISILQYTSYPSIGWWDSGGYAVHSYYLSIPAPGGSILYVILGWIFSKLFFFLPAIKTVTLVSIIATALSAVLFYYTLVIILEKFSKENEWGRLIVSFLTALSVPFLYSIWQESHVSRTYTLGLLLTGIIFLCAVLIWGIENEKKKVRLFLLVIFIMGLDFTAHRLNSPFIPVIFILMFFPLRKQLLNYKFWAGAILLYCAGFLLHLYLLIRAQYNPLLDMGNTHTLQQLISWIIMDRYGSGSNFLELFNRKAPFWSYQTYYMYLRYFGWNFIGYESSNSFISFYSVIPFILGCAGFVYSLAKKSKYWILIFIIFLMYSIILIIYLNVREGFHNTREIDRLFIPSFYIFMVWVGIGLYFLSCIVLKLSDRIRNDRKIFTAVIILLGLIILPLNIIFSNWYKCNKSKYYFPVDFAYNLLSSCEKNAVLFTNGDNDTYPLWYLQFVEGYRTDVCIANVNLLNLRSHVEQMMNEPFAFLIDSAFITPDIFKPSILEGSQLEEIVFNYSENLQADTMRFSYSGRKFGDRTVMIAQDKIILSFLRENHFNRPVYFSSTVSKVNLIGLEEYLYNVGIVNRLLPLKGRKPIPDILEKNLMDVYRFRYFNDPNVELDQKNAALFNKFRFAFNQLADHYIENGNKERAREVIDLMNKKLPSWRFPDDQNKMIEKYEKLLED